MKEFFLVFVCTGNICRSPMAEGIMKDLVLDEVDIHNQVIPIKISSAGTHAVYGSPASRYAVEVASNYGININFHRSKPVTDSIVKDADLILTMEKNHTELIKSMWPFFNEVYELKNFDLDDSLKSDSADIIDPIGMERDVYETVFNELKRGIDRISARIFSLAQKKSGN